MRLQAYLCNAQRCVLLPGAEGLTEAFSGMMRLRGLCLRFRCLGEALMPVLMGQSNQVYG
ncbi:flagellar protein FlhE [Cupriavidus basilensis]